MRRAVALLCITVLGCGASRWEAIEPKQLRDGGEALVVTETRAIHFRGVRVTRGHVEGNAVAAWNVPVEASILDDKGRGPAAMANAQKWNSVDDRPARIPYEEVLAVRVPVGDRDAVAAGGPVSAVRVIVGVIGLGLLVVLYGVGWCVRERRC